MLPWQFAATILDFRRDARVGERRQPAVGAELERLVLRAKIARPGIAARRPHFDEARQIAFGVVAVFRDHGPDFRMWEFFAQRVAGHHVIATDPVIDRLRLHAANDGQLVGVLSHLRQELADLNACDVRLNRAKSACGWAPRLHVEGVDLADAAFHVEHDAAFARSFGFGRDRLRVEQRTPVRHSHAARRDDRAFEQATAAKVLP